MYVRIRRLRYGGQRVISPGSGVPDHSTVGDLQSVQGRYELRRPLVNSDPLDVLYDARVIAVLPGVGGLIVRGYVEFNGRGVIQEWEVTPLEMIVGPDGLRSWSWSE